MKKALLPVLLLALLLCFTACNSNTLDPVISTTPSADAGEVTPGADGTAAPTPEEQKARMAEYCSHLDGKVVVYCNACLTGLLDGGADAVHLMELLTGTEKR